MSADVWRRAFDLEDDQPRNLAKSVTVEETFTFFDVKGGAMEIRSIRTKADYRRTLKEIETLMDAAPKSQKGERLDVLVTLVESYERKHFPLDLPDPVEAIKFRMEQC